MKIKGQSGLKWIPFKAKLAVQIALDHSKQYWLTDHASLASLIFEKSNSSKEAILKLEFPSQKSILNWLFQTWQRAELITRQGICDITPTARDLTMERRMELGIPLECTLIWSKGN